MIDCTPGYKRRADCWKPLSHLVEYKTWKVNWTLPFKGECHIEKEAN